MTAHQDSTGSKFDSVGFSHRGKMRRVGVLLLVALFGVADAFHASLPLGLSRNAIGMRSGAHRTAMNAATSTSRPALAKRFVQHKSEAKSFYRFLSIVYDTIVNPGHWTVEMRDEALAPAKLGWAELDTVDVGAGYCVPSPTSPPSHLHITRMPPQGPTQAGAATAARFRMTVSRRSPSDVLAWAPQDAWDPSSASDFCGIPDFE